MAGIAGIAGPGKKDLVEKMLNLISYRGEAGRKIIENNKFSIGIVWPQAQADSIHELLSKQIYQDSGSEERAAGAKVINDKILLNRDKLGVAPLYYGYNSEGNLCFASEVKALIQVTNQVTELLPGHNLNDGVLEKYYQLQKLEPLDDNPDTIAKNLKIKLENAISGCIKNDSIGSWLSGGIDSSAISALAKKHIKNFHTFAAGLRDAPDLGYARTVAEFIGSKHHEIIVDMEEMLTALPKVIYHLESFDALLVRSSIINYLAGAKASDYVSNVFSGEVGDELFAGYDYLKSLESDSLDDELIDISDRLHNTALQRVDRCSSAHGVLAHVIFANPEVFAYGLKIPAKYKLYKNVEKWILRKALEDELPKNVLNRKKAKFWEGGGVGEMLAHYANMNITNHDFKKECNLQNGWKLNSKEELMYYRIFKNTFGEVNDLNWMGRSK